jgi:hypothetical protein
MAGFKLARGPVVQVVTPDGTSLVFGDKEGAVPGIGYREQRSSGQFHVVIEEHCRKLRARNGARQDAVPLISVFH